MSETPKTGFVASRPSHAALIFELKRGDAMTRTANVHGVAFSSDKTDSQPVQLDTK